MRIPESSVLRCHEPPHIGWREWLALPALGIPAVKAKIDTGAHTSSLHTEFIDVFQRDGCQWVRFTVCPLPHLKELKISCAARLLDWRRVQDSSGHRQTRCVIETPLRIGDQEWLVELSLAARDTLRFRMLLGRSAVRGRFLIDPHASYLIGHRPHLSTLYPELSL